MSPRLRSTSLCALLCAFVLSAHLAFAQSQWKEIPVGYNMPKSVMAAAPVSAVAAATTPFPKAPKTNRYAGQGRDMNRPWEIEFHGGGFFNTDSGSGNAFALPTGTSFFGGNSLQVSSYMFGDGTSLFNQVSSATGISNTITPLDTLLAHQFGSRNNGPSLGVRFGRDLGPRFGIEFSVDWNTAAVEIRDSRLLGIQATATSFANSFADLFSNSCGCSNQTLAVQSIRRSQGSQLFWTGVVNVNLKTTGKTIPYLTFGGGTISNLGPAPHAGILGFYAFDVGGPHAETDLVNIESVTSRTQGVGVLGIGAKYFATSRWGLRLDVRDYVSPNATNTLLSATPRVATLAPAEVIGPGTTPTLVFSNDPTLGPSSLSGPDVRRIRTFKGDGLDNQINLSVGVFYRF